MCTPVALGGFMALSSIMSTGMQIKGRNQQLTEAARSQAGSAVEQTQADYQQLELQRDQERTKITVEEYRRLRQGERERGMLSAKLADAGVGGGSTLRDAVASQIQQDIDMGTLENNFGSTSAEISNQKNASYYKGRAQVNDAQSKLNTRTGGAATVLSLIGAGVQGYSSGVSTFNSIKGK